MQAARFILILYYVGLDSEQEHIKRIANRVSKGGHGIPTEDANRRDSTRFESLNAVLPYCDAGAFFDNENGFIDVAEYVNGEIIVKGEYRPQWLQALMVIYGK